MTTGNPYSELSRGARRRVVAVSVLRSAASVTVLVVLYYAAPIDGPLNLGTLVTFGLGLLVFAALTVWQVRAIIRSDVPVVRAMQALATGVTLLLVLYSALYSAIAYNQPDSFTQTLSRTDGLYFTVTVFATVGFGDIAPRSELARIVTTTQMLFGLIVFGLIVRTLLGAVQVAVRQRESERP
jgi:voltage-gated potassium channel